MRLLSSFFTAPDALEPQYRARYLAADARQTRLAIAIWLIPVILFAFADYSLFGLAGKFWTLLAVRVIFSCFSLYIIAAIAKVATAADYDRLFLRWAAVSIPVVLFFNYSWAEKAPPNGALTVLIIFSAYMVFPNRLSVRLLPPLTLSAGSLMLHWQFREWHSLTSVYSMLVSLFMANVLGIIFSTWLQDHRLTEFKARLEEGRVKEELNRLASTDELTGVYNRRRLFQLAAGEFQLFKDDGRPLSVLMMDLDHFKRLNDSYGHEAGDTILAQFAAYVVRNLPDGNIWGRLGGEEFALVLPGLSGEEAYQVAERIRSGLRDDPFLWRNRPVACTVSIGVTAARPADQSFEKVLGRADRAMYRAKRHGRDKTELI